MVRQAVEDLGYSPNLIARQLTLQKTFTLGVVIPDLENSFFATLTDSIIDAARARDYHIILTVSREKEEVEANNIRNLLGMRVDGLLVCLSQETSRPEIFKAVRKMNVPLVFFDRAFGKLEYNRVVFDDRTGTLEAITTVQVGTQVSGIVQNIYVDFNSIVKKGQLLMTLDSKVMQSSLSELDKGYELVVTLYNKQKELWDQGIGSEMQFLEVKSVIVQELELILSALEVSSPTREEVHTLIGSAPSLRYLADLNEAVRARLKHRPADAADGRAIAGKARARKLASGLSMGTLSLASAMRAR